MENEKIECIKNAIEEKVQVKIQRGETEPIRTYLVNEIVFTEEEQSAKCTREEDKKTGTIHINSLDIEKMYKKLPNKFKIKEKEEKMEDQKVIEPETQEETKVKEPEVKTEQKIGKRIPVSKFILNYFQKYKTCSHEEIEKAYIENGKIMKSFTLKDYIIALGKDGKKTGKYTIDYDKESKTYKYEEISNQNSNG